MTDIEQKIKKKNKTCFSGISAKSSFPTSKSVDESLEFNFDELKKKCNIWAYFETSSTKLKRGLILPVKTQDFPNDQLIE